MTFFMKGIILFTVRFFYITHYTLIDCDRKIIYPLKYKLASMVLKSIHKTAGAFVLQGFT